jgi:NAD-dependent SIR2 family protein deacetylase
VPVFHVEEKITLGRWDDILNRPGYQSPVEPQKFRFLRIAAVYSFKEQSARCGVSDCQQGHSQGYLVITSDEKETNLCEACGQRLLGVTFNNQKKVLQGLARIRKQQLRLNKVLEQSDVIKKRVKELKQCPKGANWLYQALTSFCKTYPADLLAALKMLATDKEDNTILNALVEEGVDPSRLEQVEQLQGLGIFAADIREELIGKILKPLKQLEEAIDDPEANPSLASYCRWADRLEEQFACAEHLVEEGRAFFDHENLERLKSIPLSQESSRFLRSVRWNGDMAVSKRK